MDDRPENGQPLTDPKRSSEGFLLPIGEYKWYGLNVVIGMLPGVLNGAAFGRNVVDFNKDPAARNNSGHMILAMRVDNFQPVEEFKREMDRVIREIRESKRMDNVDRIWLPGDMEASAGCGLPGGDGEGLLGGEK